MPFQSKAQEAFLYSQHPDVAKKWQEEYGQQKLTGYKFKAPKDPLPKSPWLNMEEKNMNKKENV